jgi:hypothetical protein
MIKPGLYRVQMSNKDWILRHTSNPLPLLRNADKEEILKQLPDYFAKSKEPILVKIMDANGCEMDELEFKGISGNP